MQKLMCDIPRLPLLQTKVRMVGMVVSLPHEIVHQRAWHAWWKSDIVRLSERL